LPLKVILKEEEPSKIFLDENVIIDDLKSININFFEKKKNSLKN